MEKKSVGEILPNRILLKAKHLQCVKLSFMIKNFEKWKVIELVEFSVEKVLNKHGKWFPKTCGNPEGRKEPWREVPALPVVIESP